MTNFGGMSLPEKVIEQVTLTDAALTKAAEMEKTAATKAAAVQRLIPTVVDAMIKHDRIGAHEREKLAEMLKDPVKTLELMAKLAGHRNTEEQARLGSPVGTKSASAGRQYDPASSLTSPHVGARNTRVKQSDCALFAKLGLPTPTGE